MKYEQVNSEEPDIKQQHKMSRHIIYKDCKYASQTQIETLQSEITSSLFLQQLMYYNIYYSALFVYLYLASQLFRILYFTMEYAVPVRLILMVIFAVLEYFRLSNGYYGNLKESFPEVLAFFLLTIFTLGDQIVCIVILPTFPMQWSLLFYGIILHALQLLVCLFAMRKLTQAQTALFFWRNSGSKLKIRYKRRFN